MINEILLTERLVLRKLSKADNNDWLEMLNSKNVGKFINQICDIESVNKIINRKLEKYSVNSGESFSVLLKGGNKVIGNVELKVDEYEKTAEISYVFNDKFWNKGYATESAKALIDYAFNVLKVDKVIADCLENNLSSCHILKDKLKMTHIGIETRIDKTTNKTLNFVCYELIKA